MVLTLRASKYVLTTLDIHYRRGDAIIVTTIIIIRSHRSTPYVDAAYFYRPSSVVCRSVCLSVTLVSPAKTAEPIEMPFGLWARIGPRNHVLNGKMLRDVAMATMATIFWLSIYGVHIGATWRI